MDIWSLGIVCIEMIQRVPPAAFKSNDCSAERLIMQGYAKLQEPEETSETLRNFLYKGCLRKNPSKRLSAEELLQHRFINQALPIADLADAMKEVVEMVPPDPIPKRRNLWQRLFRRG